MKVSKVDGMKYERTPLTPSRKTTLKTSDINKMSLRGIVHHVYKRHESLILEVSLGITVTLLMVSYLS